MTITGRAPLTPYQADIWVASQLHPDAPQFNSCAYEEITGPLDAELFQACLRRAVRRNEALRLRFDHEDGVPYQWAEEETPDVPIVDLAGEPDPRAAALAWIERSLEQSFTLRGGRLYDIGLIRLSETTAYAYMTAHHIVLDGWGGKLLMRQVWSDYRHALANGEPEETSAPSYLDFVREAQDYAGSPQHAADLDYHRTALDGAIPALFARDAGRGGYETARHSFTIAPELIQRVRDRGESPFAFVAAALGVYLSRVHRTDEVVLGVPVLNRNTHIQRRTVGHFANELPLRVRAAAGRTMRELVAEIHQTTRAAHAHERLAMGELLRALPTTESGSRQLYDVTLSWMRWPRVENVAGVQRVTAARSHAHDRDALAILVNEFDDAGALVVDVDYAADVFDADYPIESFGRHLIALITGALDAPAEAALADLTMLAPAEHDHLTLGVNPAPTAYLAEETLHGLFAAQAARTPDLIAATDADGELTYAQLDARANQVARSLRAEGIGPDDRVAILAGRGMPMLVAILGVLKAGGAYVPVDPGYPAERIRFLLADSGAKAVLVTGAPAVDLDGLPVLQIADLTTGSAEPLGPTSTSRDLAYVIYTSGSTGQPKGVMVEHHSVVNRLTWMQRAYPVGEGDVLVQKTPISFDVSVWELFWWGAVGARLVLAPPGAEKDPRDLLATIAAQQVSVIHFVPSMLGPFLDLLEQTPALRVDAASLRYVFCSGEELPRGRVEQFNRVFAEGSASAPALINLYGPTEATVDVSFFDCPAGAEPVRRVPIGRAIDNIRLYVLGPDDRPQPLGVPGELCAAGVGVARGYLDRPELTAARFVDDPFAPGERMYRTGDLARRLADGNLEYLGRIDGQVKVRGNRIELGEVQHALAGCPGVRDAVVVDQRTPERGTFLVGYYVVDGDPDPAGLRAHLGRSLPEFMVPSFLVRIDHVPLTPNGKLDRRALPAYTGDAPVDADALPRTDVERALVEIWSQVLDIPAVGIHRNYFTIGGDSILSLRIRAEAEKRGLYFALADLMQHPTVAGLAERVSTTAPDADLARPPQPFELVPQVDRARLTDVEDAFPATQMHIGLLYHSAEHEVSAFYHDVFRYSLRMPWDEPAFRAAVDKLVVRHPVLRSSFDLGSFSEPLQIIHHAVTGGLEIADLRTVDAEAAAAEILEHMQQRRYHRYDFDRAPLFLFRAHLLSESVELVFSFHHVILDGWSVATLIRDLLQDYLHLAGLEIAAVPDLALPTSAAFVVEEQRAVASAETKEFWRDRLAGAELTQIDGLRQYEPPGDDGPIIRVVPLPDDLLTQVRAFARSHGIPVKSALLAAHCLTLRLFSGSRDIVTGLVTHGRPELADAERVAGLFLNTMPLRVGDAPRTWLEMVREVYRQERECHPYRRYPLHAVQTDRGGEPVLEAVFNYVHMHVLTPVFEVPGVELLDFETWEQTNFKLLVNVFVSPVDDRIALRVDTDGRTFTPGQTDLVIETFLRILRQVLTDPDGELDFTFLAGPQGEVIPAIEGPSTIVDRLERHIRDTPDAIAVAFGELRWTYAEFDQVTTRIARRLLALGARPGDRVGIALERSPEMIAAIYGIARAGAACVPLDVTYPEDRLAAMVDQATPMRVIAHERHAHLVKDQSIVLLVEQILGESDVDYTDVALPIIDPDSLLYVLFTSGSTGAPKGVAMPHRALDNYQIWQVNAASGAARGKTLQFAPLSFDVSFQEIYSTISGGGTLQLITEEQRRDMPALLRLLDREGVERVFVPYVALQQLAETADALDIFPHNLKVVISSGEQLRITAEIRRFMAALPPGAVLENQYGPTETHLVTSYLMSGDPAMFPNLPPIGPATNGVELYLLDDAMRPVPQGALGELYFGGVQLADGYYGQPELTRQRFIPNPFGEPGSRLYRTGDLARVLPSGDLMWAARTDTQTKIRGFRVEPLEVEIAIMKLAEHHPGIREAAVVARRREGVDSFLAAFLVGDPDTVDLADLRKRLRMSLPDYMVPSHFSWLDAMPLTPSGKRNDAGLRQMPLTVAGAADQVPPRDHYEQSLVEILAELLQVPSVGVQDNFFEIGGTSLTAMRLVVMIEKRYGLNVPLSVFVTTPTVAGLADVLRAGNASAAFDPVVAIRRDGDRRPVFLVHPVGGNVLCYVRLAQYLPTDQPVYALQAAGSEAGTEPLRSVPEIASFYLDAIRRVQPEGPYTIGGWSFGGIVAFEMARQLRESDTGTIDNLILIDPIVRRSNEHDAVADSALLEWFFWELILLGSNGRTPTETIPAGLDTHDAKFDFIAQRATEAGVLRPGSSRAAVRRLFEMFKAHWEAIVSYQPDITDQDITLLRASEPLPQVLRPIHEAAGGTLYLDPMNGWGRLTSGRIDVVNVPGDHLVLMEEPYVGEVARHLAKVLAEPQTPRVSG